MILRQAARFVIVGIINTVIDFAILNILIYFFTAGSGGRFYLFFKSISFLVAVTNSYFMNKYWAFSHGNTPVSKKEVFSFFSISVVGFFMNVLIATAFFHILSSSLSTILAANAGAVIATLVVLVWNFFGYRLFVFKQ